MTPTRGSYLRNALHEGGAPHVACLPAPRAFVSLLPLYCPLVLVDSTTFFAINYINTAQLIIGVLLVLDINEMPNNS
jgi:hypothetical protein